MIKRALVLPLFTKTAIIHGMHTPCHNSKVTTALFGTHSRILELLLPTQHVVLSFFRVFFIIFINIIINACISYLPSSLITHFFWHICMISYAIIVHIHFKYFIFNDMLVWCTIIIVRKSTFFIISLSFRHCCRFVLSLCSLILPY